jgi:NAD(P)H-dependent FMN reductase
MSANLRPVLIDEGYAVTHSPVARFWNHKVAEAKAFVANTAEHNHVRQAVSKNAGVFYSNHGKVTG